jgi:D-alanyl-lipoteichoic acid acyltransferase DltB (MBOAT superfamily)
VPSPPFAAAAAAVASMLSPSFLLPAIADRRVLVNEALIPLVRRPKRNRSETRERERLGFCVANIATFLLVLFSFLFQSEERWQIGEAYLCAMTRTMCSCHPTSAEPGRPRDSTTRSNSREIVPN